MSWWQKVLGLVRRILNRAHDAGMIPSQKPTIPVQREGK